MVEPHMRHRDRSRTFPQRESDLDRVTDCRRAGVVAAGLEVIGEPLAGVAVVDQ